MLSLAVAGAAPVHAADDPDAAVRQEVAGLIATDARLATVGYRIARANRALCPHTGPLFDMVVEGPGQYAPAARDAFGTITHVRDGVGIVAVVPGSPAARDGLAPGDMIVAINGVAIETPEARPDRHASYAAVGQAWDALGTAAAAGPVTLTLMRDGASVTRTWHPDIGCAARFQVVPGGKWDAGSNGTLISVESAVADFATSDDELAFVVAHELSHNIWDDPARIRAARRARAGDIVGMERVSEDRADHLALWLMARAGYDPTVVPAFWRRVARRNLFSRWLSDGAHASNGRRAANAARALPDVLAARAAGRLDPPVDLLPPKS